MSAENIIYALVDPRTEKIRYIGQSSKGLARPRQHYAPSTIHSNRRLKGWIVKLLSFGYIPKIRTLAECESPEELDTGEIFWIAWGRAVGWPLTNIANGGEAVMRGRKHSPETLAKFALIHTGRKHTPETRALMSAVAKGHKVSAETRRKMSETRVSKRTRPLPTHAEIWKRAKELHPDLLAKRRQWYQDNKEHLAQERRKQSEALKKSESHPPTLSPQG